MSTNSWDELSPGQKLIVLNWAKEGMIKQTASSVGHIAQHAMIRDIQNKAAFDPTEFYDRIHPRSRAHWDHIEKYVAMIDEEICKIKREMAAEYSPPDDQVDGGTDVIKKEVLIPPKKSKKKKKKKETPKYPESKGGCGNGRQ